MPKVPFSVLTISLFTLLAGLPSAQDATGQAPMPEPVLKGSDLTALNKKLRAWYEAQLDLIDAENENTGQKGRSKSFRKRRNKLRDASRKKKVAFFKDFAKRSKKAGNLYRSVPDLLKISEGCFPYERLSNGGRPKTIKLGSAKEGKNRKSFAIRYPKAYKPNRDWPLILSLPDRSGSGWTRAEQHIEKAWPGSVSEVVDHFVHICPDIPEGLDLSGVSDPRKPDDEADNQRKDAVLFALGQAFQRMRVDTNRVYLEATGASTPTAMRIASLFPDRFAGLILKNPAGLENLSSQNLHNLPIAIIHDEASEGVAKEIAKEVPNTELKKAGDTAPFGGSAAWLAEWAGRTRRNLFTSKVVIEQAHEIYRKAYWLEIVASESLESLPADKRPKITATVDRKANKVTIKSRGIDEVRILLNDLLVDLDKEITIDRNGKLEQLKLARNTRLVFDPDEGLIFGKGDPGFIFLAVAYIQIPPNEDGKDDAGGQGEAKNPPR